MRAHVWPGRAAAAPRSERWAQRNVDARESVHSAKYVLHPQPSRRSLATPRRSQAQSGSRKSSNSSNGLGRSSLQSAGTPTFRHLEHVCWVLLGRAACVRVDLSHKACRPRARCRSPCADGLPRMFVLHLLRAVNNLSPTGCRVRPARAQVAARVVQARGQRLRAECRGGPRSHCIVLYGTTQLKPQGQARVATAGPPVSV